ncbi:MAG: PAC2 family protein [Micrococcales bacterium]|nr:PAC2 family protein [Actinomycetota bacterium]NCA07143.1 PAC2 family protein [Micrococcales bacterium]
MAQQENLFTLVNPDIQVPEGLHLFAAISGFTDAGSAMQQVTQQILGNLDFETIATFDNDQLLDYRSRRPVMFFEQDHIEDYQPASLSLLLVKDEVGTQFLFLNGYEPDFKWEAFASSIEVLFSYFAIRDMTWLHAIPFPIPHTRPVGVTVSGNQKNVIAKFSEWKPRTQVPGNIMHLLEFRLTQADIPSTGFVLLVPHYLSDSEYPQAAVSGIELISGHLGLVFPTDELRDEGVAFTRRITQQMAENQELSRMVESLETSFQSEKASNGMGAVKPREREIPDADQIAAELEGYLASHQKNKLENDEDQD